MTSKEYSKIYRENNKEKIRISNKKWRDKNKERLRILNREWSRNNPDKVKAYRRNRYAKDINGERTKQRLYHRNFRLFILQVYGGNPPKCECCGEDKIEFLTIDHINGGGTQQRKKLKGTSFYRWLKLNNFPKGYRVLCMNCNFALGHSGYCPHNKEER